MPDGLGLIVGILAVGYLLLFFELFLPGGVIGIFGFIAVIYGCYLAFGLGGLWGPGTIILSIVVTGLAVYLFFHSRYGRRLVLNDERSKTWKAQEADLERLLDQPGLSLSDLRPAGLGEFQGRRVDVVTDGEYIEQNRPIRVIEVEGNRVVVEEAVGSANVTPTDS